MSHHEGVGAGAACPKRGIFGIIGCLHPTKWVGARRVAQGCAPTDEENRTYVRFLFLLACFGTPDPQFQRGLLAGELPLSEAPLLPCGIILHRQRIAQQIIRCHPKHIGNLEHHIQ